ncbi:MAG: hypothetical protein KC994_15110, partial [Candidatus Omnitrophica bacterium]|nr:hypothetical protein [Candidatus Omnitrophota bacterium]
MHQGFHGSVSFQGLLVGVVLRLSHEAKLAVPRLMREEILPTSVQRFMGGESNCFGGNVRGRKARY